MELCKRGKNLHPDAFKGRMHSTEFSFYSPTRAADFSSSPRQLHLVFSRRLTHTHIIRLNPPPPLHIPLALSVTDCNRHWKSGGPQNRRPLPFRVCSAFILISLITHSSRLTHEITSSKWMWLIISLNLYHHFADMFVCDIVRTSSNVQ